MNLPRRPERVAATALLISALLAALALAAPAVASDSFFDDFDQLDPLRWRISDGWANGRHQNCTWTQDRVQQDAGILTFTLAHAPNALRDYECGEIFTRDRFGHGTYEARLKTGVGSGMNAAFFTYIGPTHGEPHHEIDFEVLTRNPYRVSLNTYVDGEPQNGAVAWVAGGAHRGFHHFAFVWEPDRIRWYVDGNLVHQATETLPSRRQKIYFSLWGTDVLTRWMGDFEYPGTPVQMEVDWVAYTTPGDACVFPDSITCPPQ